MRFTLCLRVMKNRMIGHLNWRQKQKYASAKFHSIEKDEDKDEDK